MSKNRRVRIVNKSSVGDPDKEERAMGKALFDRARLTALFMEFDKAVEGLVDPYGQLRAFFNAITKGVPKEKAAWIHLRMDEVALSAFFEEHPKAEAIARALEAQVVEGRYATFLGKGDDNTQANMAHKWLQANDPSYRPKQQIEISDAADEQMRKMALAMKEAGCTPEQVEAAIAQMIERAKGA